MAPKGRPHRPASALDDLALASPAPHDRAWLRRVAVALERGGPRAPRPPPASCALLAAALGPRPDLGAVDDDDKLHFSSEIARIQRAAAARLARLGPAARAALPALAAALAGAPVAGCAPACCEASAVRRAQREAKAALLGAIGRVDPGGAALLAPATVAWLLAPPGRRLSLPALALLARSPAAARAFRAEIAAALGHPDWRVVGAAARALGAAGPHAPSLGALARGEARAPRGRRGRPARDRPARPAGRRGARGARAGRPRRARGAGALRGAQDLGAARRARRRALTGGARAARRARPT
ncbi:MAG TPA: hypothetical protein VFS43_42690 [Polyangiaceae bacterium]|nr:hypothetical protein [Polyangiaceae bacterium]